MEFLPYISKWIEILLRWSHVMFAILWVGNSFLFNYLDNKLEKNTTSKEVDANGILQHSGWFYRLERLKIAPEKFNVANFKNLNKENVVNKSKTTGEPPLMLAMSVFFAIKDAIASVGNYTKIPELNAPATPEAILLSIKDLKNKL